MINKVRVNILFFFIFFSFLSASGYYTNSFNSIVEKKVDSLRKLNIDTCLISGTVCSGCNSFYKGRIDIFYHYQNHYFVNSVLYQYDAFSKKPFSILKDTIIKNYSTEYLFHIFNMNATNIINQCNNIDSLAGESYFDGRKDSVYIDRSDGKYNYLNLSFIRSQFIVKMPIEKRLNYIYSKAYYYWLINSLMNNILSEIYLK